MRDYVSVFQQQIGSFLYTHIRDARGRRQPLGNPEIKIIILLYYVGLGNMSSAEWLKHFPIQILTGVPDERSLKINFEEGTGFHWMRVH